MYFYNIITINSTHTYTQRTHSELKTNIWIIIILGKLVSHSLIKPLITFNILCEFFLFIPGPLVQLHLCTSVLVYLTLCKLYSSYFHVSGRMVIGMHLKSKQVFNFLLQIYLVKAKGLNQIITILYLLSVYIRANKC